ncbi:MAG: tetratricopeptide repeat protein [Longimicrobiales bacterium]
MIDRTRVLRPLDDAAAALEQLDDYQTTAELASAVQGTAQAVDRVLRNLLRSDSGTPDELRLSALSSAELPHDRLIPALRQRNLISLQLAGQVHELEQAARRAAAGDVRAADGDQALHVVQTLRAEVSAASDKPVLAAAHHAVESGMLDLPVRAVPSANRQKQLYRRVGLAGALLLLGALLITLVTKESDLEKGIAAFKAQRWDVAEEHLARAAGDQADATAQLYLARVYRRQERYDRAAAVLKQAATRHSQDDDIWRELGNLFLDLNQPEYAVERFRRAQELDPDEKLNWIGLVHAMRAAGDPSSEQVLQQAPAEVRAAMTRVN